jgi:hypothetical protein
MVDQYIGGKQIMKNAAKQKASAKKSMPKAKKAKKAKK